ncbi:hypothetical protein [Streptomyces sp. HF10]|uniref:hypothetical protein n=1 Tax=Streptomyces sp. HF10 TaxID=2692233 RepID=UPI0013172AE8|nr:hypothetical protein [Streptomyces sp. HF10]QHC27755.1 hypothetical protein GR129_01725 [Streptomyces sp. HF10]
MSAAARAMRRLSARLLESLPTPDGDADLIPLLGQALTTVRGRKVRLPAAAFPPVTASGLWVDRTSHDQILYEENTDPEHQLVVIGHEAWHMFHGDRTDTALHHAARSDSREVAEEFEAERFGLRLATDLQATLRLRDAPVDPYADGSVPARPSTARPPAAVGVHAVVRRWVHHAARRPGVHRRAQPGHRRHESRGRGRLRGAHRVLRSEPPADRPLAPGAPRAGASRRTAWPY